MHLPHPSPSPPDPPTSSSSSSSKRKWPFRLSRLLLSSILLALALTLAISFSFHLSQYVPPSLYSSLSFCRPSSSSPSPWISPSDWLLGPSLRHNMSDPHLLWLASFEPRRHWAPPDRIPKVAFMFLSRGPLPLAPLWERFFKGHYGLYSIYVHTDPKFTLDVAPHSVFYGRQIPSQETRWGDISMIDAERRLIANALLDFANERFILLSEACIPLHPFPTVYSHLIVSNSSFVGSFDDPGPYGRGRYNWNMAPVVKIEQWRKGSQWFELNRQLATFVVSDVSYYPKFRDFCKPACYVDEHYLPTMLSIEFGSAIANTSITWVDWSRGGPHPAMFGKDDITKEFIMRIRGLRTCTYNGHSGAICFLFGRKFSPNTLAPLLQLAAETIGI